MSGMDRCLGVTLDSSRGERYKRLFLALGAFHFAPEGNAHNDLRIVNRPRVLGSSAAARGASFRLRRSFAVTGWCGEVAGDGGRLYEMRASDVPGYTKPPLDDCGAHEP